MGPEVSAMLVAFYGIGLMFSFMNNITEPDMKLVAGRSFFWPLFAVRWIILMIFATVEDLFAR